jgi:hypothetical protein
VSLIPGSDWTSRSKREGARGCHKIRGPTNDTLDKQLEILTPEAPGRISRSSGLVPDSIGQKFTGLELVSLFERVALPLPDKPTSSSAMLACSG